IVLDQDPSAGAKVKEHSRVRLNVSRGPPLVAVPLLASTDDEAAARAKIEQAGLTVGTVQTPYSEDVPKGRVLSSSPTGRAPKGSKVTVSVSKGPDLVTVPNVVGKSAVDAEKALNAAGLVVSSVSGPPTGVVFATSPPAGTQVHRGSGVILATKH